MAYPATSNAAHVADMRAELQRIAALPADAPQGLPGAFYTVHETRVPPVGAFRRHGVPVAVATDCNPGSSPLASLKSLTRKRCWHSRRTCKKRVTFLL